MRSLIVYLGLGAAAAAAACNPFDPDYRTGTPFKCGATEPRCPDGFECVTTVAHPQGVCSADGNVPGAVDASAAGGDSGGAFSCNDDSPIEPNDEINQATTTPIPDQQLDYRLVGLSVCPGGDVDVFRFRVDVTATNIQVDFENMKAQGELIGEILNAAGNVVATGQYDSTDRLVRVTLNNAPTGTFYARIRGAAETTQNNYNVEIQLTPPGN